PCRKRAITMTARLGAAPTAAEVSVNATVATMKNRLRPSRSVSHPVMGRLIALATRKEVSTHVISSTAADSVPRMWSRATLAMVTSRMTRNVAIIVEIETMARFMGPRSSQPDGGDDRHAGHQQRVAV